MNQLEAVERRRRTIRIVLFSIILGTLPIYCLGIGLWLTAPAGVPRTPTSVGTTSVATLQVSGTSTLRPTLTQFQFPTQNVPTLPPQQFTFVPPPTSFIPTAVIPTATNFIFPTSTIAPTLTFIPTFTVGPTDTTIPLPTIEIPTEVIPSATFTETPTETATAEEATPIPFS